MTTKVFIEHDDTVTVSCSQCKKTRTINVSRFAGHTRARVKCSCGHVQRVELEKRKQYRKATDLKGIYKVVKSEIAPPDSGIMTVVNISRNGVRMKFKTPPFFNVGDLVNIRFNLDDKAQSLVDRDVLVRNIEFPYVGAKFSRSYDMDNVIGFYLFR